MLGFQGIVKLGTIRPRADTVGVEATRAKRGKITAALGFSRNKGNSPFRRRPNSRALERAEVEQLILFDRTPNAAAELVSLERVVRWREEVPGVQGPLSKKLKRAAVNLVRSRLGGDVDDTASRVSILRTQVVCLKIELLDGIGIGKG